MTTKPQAVVNPARAGMILRPSASISMECGKPRASGDDPRLARALTGAPT